MQKFNQSDLEIHLRICDFNDINHTRPRKIAGYRYCTKQLTSVGSRNESNGYFINRPVIFNLGMLFAKNHIPALGKIDDIPQI